MPTISTNIGRISYEKKLGVGVFSQVYQGTYQQRSVAIKIIDCQSKNYNIKSVQQESKILSQLKHDHIVKFFGSYWTEEKIYIVLELLEKGTLSALIYSEEPLSMPLCESLAEDIMAGLGCIHSSGFLHRDIKPDNILISQHNRAKITDFGFAIPTAEATTLSDLAGTARYISPKLATYCLVRGGRYDQDESDDIWALGITLLEMLHRTPPYEMCMGTLRELWQNIVDEKHDPIPSNATRFLAAVIAGCLQTESLKNNAIPTHNSNESQPIKTSSRLNAPNSCQFWSTANQQSTATSTCAHVPDRVQPK